MIGNPYPCAIDWTQVSRGAGVSNFVYIYDTEGAGNYVILDALDASHNLLPHQMPFGCKQVKTSTVNI